MQHPRPLARIATRLAAALSLTVLSACAATDPQAGFAGLDPYEDTNRTFHNINVKIDNGFLRPVAKGYDAVTPMTIQHIIGNGLNHVELPVDFVNYLLQGEAKAAGRVFGRFLLNTVLGAGGLLDPATEFGLPREETDFGVTLGKWGVESGPYLVLPVFGPTTRRDLLAFPVDIAFQPLTYAGIFVDPTGVIGGPRTVLDTVDGRNRNADLIDEVLYNSPDSYVTLRSVFLQRRQAQVLGEESTEALPDIFDEQQ